MLTRDAGAVQGNVDKYLGDGYLVRSDAEFMKLALRFVSRRGSRVATSTDPAAPCSGITVIIASGDTGAGDLGGPPMGYDNCDVLHPDWPSQSPYVTAVGSTYITPYADPICYMPRESGACCSSRAIDRASRGAVQAASTAQTSRWARSVCRWTSVRDSCSCFGTRAEPAL
jgi:hypothetical protein